MLIIIVSHVIASGVSHGPDSSVVVNGVNKSSSGNAASLTVSLEDTEDLVKVDKVVTNVQQIFQDNTLL